MRRRNTTKRGKCWRVKWRSARTMSACTARWPGRMPGLGRKGDAVREALRGVELYPPSRDALAGNFRLYDLARVYTMVGDYEAAADQLDRLLSSPSQWSIKSFEVDPFFDALRPQPAYRRLAERHR
jgi:hypothetical protein